VRPGKHPYLYAAVTLVVTAVFFWVSCRRKDAGPGAAAVDLPPILSSPDHVGTGSGARQRTGANSENSAEENFRALLQEDPARAAAALSQAKNYDLWDAWLTPTMTRWAEIDPEGAIGWLESLPQGDFRTEAGEELLFAWAQKSPDEGIAWITGRLAEGKPPEALAAFVSAWAENDPGSVREWLETLGGNAPPEALSILAYAWAASSPGKASRWINSLDDADLRGRLAISYSTSRAIEDPAGAMLWLKSGARIGHESRDSAMLTTLQIWAHGEDPEGAARWLSRTPEGDFKERGKIALGLALSESDPQRALGWAGEITDPTDQSGVVTDIYDTWLDEDTEAAKLHLLESLNTMPADNENRRALLELLYEHDPDFKSEVLDPFLGQ